MKETQNHTRPVKPPAILVIDDDRAAADVTQTTLSDAGYQVLAEAQGDVALKLIRSSPMQLVVSELYIPAAESQCVVTALKAERSRIPRVRVLVHSRHKTPTDVEFALTAGADAFIRKPARADILLREVERLAGPAR